MRVSQTQRTTASRRSGPARAKISGGGFKLERSTEARKASSARGPAVLSSIDAIVALQAVDDPAERRRKAVRQGTEALDALDDLKIALLSGQLAPAKLTSLKAIVEDYSADDLSPELADVLRQIDLRARVELAKLAKSGKKTR